MAAQGSAAAKDDAAMQDNRRLAPIYALACSCAWQNGLQLRMTVQKQRLGQNATATSLTVDFSQAVLCLMHYLA